MALLLLLALQDPEADSLMRRLGDNDPSERDRAALGLRTLGARARPLLEKARDGDDVDLRVRATAILAEIQRDLADADLERKQRQGKLGYVSLDVRERPLREVLPLLEEQTFTKFWTKDLDLDRVVSLKVDHALLEAALASCGLATTHFYPGAVSLELRTTPEGGVYAEGGIFRFQRRPWAPKGETLGTIFATEFVRTFDVETEWDVAAVRTDKDLPLETCTVHSPALVYVPGAAPAEARIALRGLRRWYCDTPLVLEALDDGQFVRTGGFEVIVRWPRILVRSSKAVPAGVLARVLSAADIDFDLKPGRKGVDTMGIGGGGGGGRYGGRFTNEPRAWCGCIGKPSQEPRQPPKTETERLVDIEHGADRYSVGDIARIRLTFHRPVEEPFTLESPPLK